MGGFSNQTMRQPKEGKPHIARIAGYWRVSPWRRDTASLYYEAHRWAVWRNRIEANAKAGVANCHSPHSNLQTSQQGEQEQRDRQRQLAKQLRHGLNYGMGAGDILRILEAQIEARVDIEQEERETKQ